MPQPVTIGKIQSVFRRHERQYCFFTITGRDEDFLYYTHTSCPLRSLVFGRDFVGQIPQLIKDEEQFIECGLGLLVEGGVALDSEDFVAWHYSIAEANRVLTGLRGRLGEEGQWIRLFSGKRGVSCLKV
jgi:hypothetical protein